MSTKNSQEPSSLFTKISGDICGIVKDRFKAKVSVYQATWIEFKVNGRNYKIEIKEVNNEL